MQAVPCSNPQLTELRSWLDKQGIALEWVEKTGSTNSDLLQRLQQDSLPCVTLRVAQQQDAGRGQHGRSWSGQHKCAMFSLALPWAATLDGLSLVVGVAIVQGLTAMLQRLAANHSNSPTVQDNPALGLKWPNDIWLNQRKLGGVLIESRWQAPRPMWLVVGVAINLEPPPQLPGVASLDELGLDTSSEQVILAVMQCLWPAFDTFRRFGFAAFATQWRQLDALAGHDIQVLRQGGPPLLGKNLGCDERGQLRLQTPSGAVSIMSGQVSVRSQRDTAYG